MKNKKMCILLVLMLLSCFSGMALAVSTYTETFEDDTLNTNPSATWYDYSEVGWAYANVQNDYNHSGSKSFRVNDTNGAGNYSTFTITTAEKDFEYFSFWFQVDNTSVHNGHYGHNATWVNISYSGTSLCGVNISNYSAINVAFKNSTATKYTATGLLNMTWYRLRFDFNYTTDMVQCRLYNSGGTMLNSGWLHMDRADSDLSGINTVTISGRSGQPSDIWFDDFVLYGTAGYSRQTHNLVSVIIPLLGALVILVTIIGLLLAGGLTRETLLGIMAAIIIGVIVIQVIYSMV